MVPKIRCFQWRVWRPTMSFGVSRKVWSS
ncbi:hypothetical protein LINPERPRIM_LOCUS17434 [Linum perenne]